MPINISLFYASNYQTTSMIRPNQLKFKQIKQSKLWFYRNIEKKVKKPGIAELNKAEIFDNFTSTRVDHKQCLIKVRFA